jgi:hypothetical protein
MNKKINLAIGVLLAIMLLTASQIGRTSAANGSDAHIRVAVLNSADHPAYGTGAANNFYQQALDVLNNDPTNVGDIVATNITNADVESGALANYDVLFLADNWPNLTANENIINFWNKTNGGGIVALDSSIAFLCYAGILPAEANGTNGRNLYWDYNTKLTAQITAAHPITAGYTVGQNITAPGATGDARYLIANISTTAGYPYFTMLANEYHNTSWSYVSAYNPPNKGRVVHIWDQQPSDQATRFLIFNAVRWAANAPSLTQLIDTLQTQISTLQTQLTTLQGQLTTAQSTIATLTSSIASLQNQITSLQEQLSAMNQTQTTTTDNLNTTTMMSYAGIAVGVVGVVIAVVAIALARRKPAIK